MKTFKTRFYHIKNEKMKGSSVKFVFISDLHGFCFGENNRDLLAAIREQNPDFILAGGDIINRLEEESYPVSMDFMKELAKEYTIYYAMGNHESKRRLEKNPLYLNYEETLKANGVQFLYNDSLEICNDNCRLFLHAVEIPIEYYKKPFPEKFRIEEMRSLLQEPEKDGFHILMAHNPLFMDTYLQWGADLILAGHYHGGMVRLTENIGLVSSYGHPFPKYCCGRFEHKKQTILVSPGLGEHSVPIRIHNPRELFVITCE